MTHRQRRLAESGYNLVALMVIVAVLLILLGVAVPGFELESKRERETEAIFRGLQIAEAIRVFQLRQGRLPVTLDELLEVEPRSIRQLWTDPLTKDGVWGLVRGGAVPVAGDEGEEDGETEEGDFEDPFAGEVEADDEGVGGGSDSSLGLAGPEPQATASLGPISGVFSRAAGAATILFFGEDLYKEWRFTPELLPKPIVGAAGDIVARANAATVGRSFPYGLAPAGLSALEPDDLPTSGGATDVFGDDETDEEAADEDEGFGFDDDEDDDEEVE